MVMHPNIVGGKTISTKKNIDPIAFFHKLHLLVCPGLISGKWLKVIFNYKCTAQVAQYL